MFTYKGEVIIENEFVLEERYKGTIEYSYNVYLNDIVEKMITNLREKNILKLAQEKVEMEYIRYL